MTEEITLIAQREHRSIHIGFSAKIPFFAVITGLNGSGKSHLLEAIANQAILSKDEYGNHLNRFRLATHTNLIPDNQGYTVAKSTRTNKMNNLHANYTAWINSIKSQPNYNFHLNAAQSANDRLFNSLRRIARNSGKPIDKLSIEDFHEHYPIDDLESNSDIFSQAFSFIFKSYQIKKTENEFNEFLEKKKGKATKWLDEAEFVGTYGQPPWDFLNEILEYCRMNYFVKEPSPEIDTPYEFMLFKRGLNKEISFQDLSSGEKILISLACSLYNARFSEITEFPQLVLLDEPDAPLHPAMSKTLMDVLYKVFHIEKKIGVILTTHNPITVALAPEESLFEATRNKKGELILAKQSKLNAVRSLTTGITSLVFDTDNRKQVFVEGRLEMYYWQQLFGILAIRGLISDTPPVVFIAPSETANSAQVSLLCTSLREGGNSRIFGIIDWDTKNTESVNVFIPGKGKRHSIENYIFDPFALLIFLSKEKIIKTEEYFGGSAIKSHEIPNREISEIQNSIDALIKKILQEDISEKEQTTYANGSCLHICNNYMRMNGHLLEKKIKDAFPELKRFVREGDLKKEIIKKVFDDFPETIPEDLITTIKRIQASTN